MGGGGGGQLSDWVCYCIGGYGDIVSGGWECEEPAGIVDGVHYWNGWGGYWMGEGDVGVFGEWMRIIFGLGMLLYWRK